MNDYVSENDVDKSDKNQYVAWDSNEVQSVVNFSVSHEWNEVACYLF